VCGYALLVQAAHPLVAAGIVAHSSFRESPWRRLAGTMGAIYTVVYGTRVGVLTAGLLPERLREQVDPARFRSNILRGRTSRFPTLEDGFVFSIVFECGHASGGRQW
jgi:hypothetical protein